MGDRSSGAAVIDNCPSPEGEQNVKLNTRLATNEGISLQSFEGRSSHRRAVESGQEEARTSPETTMRSRISHQTKTWSATLDDGLRSTAMVFTVEKLSWIGKLFTFYRIHAGYFLLLGTFGTLVLYMLPLSNSGQLSLVDAVYTSFSVLCGIGFQTVGSQALTYSHLLVIWLLMNLGAPVVMSLLPLIIRRLYFYLCIKQNAGDVARDPESSCTSLGKQLRACQVSHDEENQGVNSKAHLQQHLDASLNPGSTSQVTMRETEAMQAQNVKDNHGQSAGMEDEEGGRRMFVDAREALRTLEYRALMAIGSLVMWFFAGVQFIGFIIGALYLHWSPHDAGIVDRKGLNPTFYALFTSTATFTNSGYFLTNESMIPFQRSSFLLMLYAILPLLGNTLYPPFLRLLVWIRHKRACEEHKPVYQYLLEHPRRCFISLFPRSQTMWLVVAFVAFTSIQLIILCSLEWDMALAGMTPVQKLVAGAYQAVNTRSAGGTVINLYQLAPAILFFFGVMMHISAYPVFLSLQTSDNINNYDDTQLMASQSTQGQVKKLNIWGINIIAIQSLTTKLLAEDATVVIVAILFLCLSESKSIKEDPLNFSIFNIGFEVISAYGSIGLSIGYQCELQRDMKLPCQEVPYSFSGIWSSLGKLILVVIMFCGRHRGLPSNIDSAVRLPTRPMLSDLPRPSQVGDNSLHLVEKKSPMSSNLPRSSRIDDNSFHLVKMKSI